MGRRVAGLVLLACLLPAAALAQGPIVLDGAGDDWDASWQVAGDPLDVFLTDLQTHPHEAPTYARSGYDATALWAHYQTGDDRWYFRIDVDGRAGDSDSQTGTAPSLGVGTHGPDQGPLVVAPFTDGLGLSNSESYKIGFQFSSGGAGLTTELGPGTAIQPGVLSATGGSLAGQGIYDVVVPGVVEFAVDRAALFPAGSNHNQLWLSAQVGDNNDRVSDDQVPAVWVLGLDLQVLCPEAPATEGEQATFPLSWSIPAGSALGPTDVVLSVQVPAGTTFVSASNGGQESGGTITWQLGDLAPGDAGQVTFTLLVETDVLTLNSQISSAEGLSYQASNECPVEQPPPTPTPLPTPRPTPSSETPPVVPEPSTITLALAGLSSLVGYAGWQWRKRGRS